MLRRTIILSGKVAVENVLFSWCVTDDVVPELTVSHHVYGRETWPLADTDPRVQARTIARAMWRRGRASRRRAKTS
jgi:hypothetical protein